MQVFGDVTPPPPNPSKKKHIDFVIDFYTEKDNVQ
jgi:hypothetical protein